MVEVNISPLFLFWILSSYWSFLRVFLCREKIFFLVYVAQPKKKYVLIMLLAVIAHKELIE